MEEDYLGYVHEFIAWADCLSTRALGDNGLKVMVAGLRRVD